MGRMCVRAQVGAAHPRSNPSPSPLQKANYVGSITQSSTTSLGLGEDGKDVYVPFKDLLPMVDPNQLHFDGE